MKRILSLMCVGWVGCAMLAGADGPVGGTKDFFDVVGVSPAEIASAISGESMLADCALEIVGVPMSDAHRVELVAALRERADLPGAATARRWLVDLLEESGRDGEALEVLRKAPGTRAAGLLWKRGIPLEDPKSIQSSRSRGGDADAILWSARIDLATGNKERALRMLGYLETCDRIPAADRMKVAAFHLEIARREGKTADLLAEDRPDVLRAGWLAQLNRGNDAKALAAKAGKLSSDGVAMWIAAIGATPELESRVRELLKDRKMGAGERCKLLELAPSDGRKRLGWWLDMGAGHGEVLELGCSIPGYRTNTDPSLEMRKIDALLVRNPGDARIRLFGAMLAPEGSRERRAMLLETARAFKKLSPDGMGNSEGYHDPAARALVLLVPLTTSRERDDLLEKSAVFRKLPPNDRLRYRMASELDRRVLESIGECDFKSPYPANPGNRVAWYFTAAAGRAEVPADAAEVVLGVMTDAVLAPGEGTILERARSWSRCLEALEVSRETMVKAVTGMLEHARRAGGDAEAQVTRGLGQEVRQAMGMPPAVPTPMPTPKDWAALLVAFAPERDPLPNQVHLGCSMFRQGFYRSKRPLSSQAVMALDSSCGWQNLCGLLGVAENEPGPLARKAAEVRKLFPEDSARARIYDVAVATGEFGCPSEELKATAKRRAAAIMGEREPDDPLVAFYLYAHRLVSKDGEGLPEPVGLETADFPSFIRRALEKAAQMAFSNGPSAKAEMARGYIGSRWAAEAAQQPVVKEPGERERFEELFRTGKLGSDESVALAWNLALEFSRTSSGSARFDPIAAGALEKAGKRSGLFAEVRARMVKEGKREVEIRRMIHRLHGVGRSGAAAAGILLELDGTDVFALEDVLDQAVAEGDQAAALKCLAGLAHTSYGAFSRIVKLDPDSSASIKPSPLVALKGVRAGELADALLAEPLAMPRPGESTLGYHGSSGDWMPLYRHFLVHAPDRLAAVIRWSGMLSPERAAELLRIASQMQAAGRGKDAVALLAEAFFKAPDPIEDDLRFPPRIIERLLLTKGLSIWSLAQSGLLKPLAEEAERADSVPALAGMRAVVLLGADPREETWQRVVRPYLDSLYEPGKRGVMNRMHEFLMGAPQAEAFVARLEPEARPEVAPTLQNIPQKLEIATDQAGVAALWRNAGVLLDQTKSPYEKRRFLAIVAKRLASAADDTVWSDFMDRVKRSGGFERSDLQSLSDIRLYEVPCERRAGLVRWFAGLDHGEKMLNTRLCGWFGSLLAEQPADLGTLKDIASRIDWTKVDGGPGRTPALLVAYDLVRKLPDAAHPVVSARIGPDGMCQVRWTLAGSPAHGKVKPSAEYLGGLFDLEILAGGFRDRMERVGMVERAASNGECSVRVPDGAHYVSLVARTRDGGPERLSPISRIDDMRAGVVLALAPGKGAGTTSGNAAAGVTGPFGEKDILTVKVPPSGKIDLYCWKNPGKTLPVVSGWLRRTDGYGRLALEGRHHGTADKTSSGAELYGDSAGVREWSRVSSRSGQEKPVAADEVVLTVSNVANTPAEVSLVGFMELRQPEKPPAEKLPLPPGAVRVGTIPGGFTGLAWDAADETWLVSNYRAFGVFDPASGAFSGWKPATELAGDWTSFGDFWSGKAGKRVISMKSDGICLLYHLDGGKAVNLGAVEGYNPGKMLHPSVLASPCLSHDGSLIATPGRLAGLRLTRIGEHALGETRLLETGRILGILFAKHGKSVDAWDTRHRYTLPLDSWLTAEMKAAPLPADGTGSTVPSLTLFRRAGTSGPPFYLNFAAASSREYYWKMKAGTRELWYPYGGRVAIDSKGVPYFSANDEVYRVDVSRIEGYQPPPADMGRPEFVPDEDGERLRYYIETNRTDHPECRSLALGVLNRYLETERALMNEDELWAVRVLSKGGEWKSVLDGIREALARKGTDETGIRRALFRAHGGGKGAGLAVAAPSAVALLEMDPRDPDANDVLLDFATRGADRKTAMSCLVRLAHASYPRFAKRASYMRLADAPSDPSPLDMFRNSHAVELADGLLAEPLAEGGTRVRKGPGDDDWGAFYGLIAEHAPDRLSRILRWSGVTNGGNAAEAILLTQAHIKVLGEAEALALLCDGVLGGPDRALADLSPWHFERLSKCGLLGKLAEAAAVPKKGSERIALAVRMVADPRISRWREIGAPMTRGLSGDDRREYLGRLATLLTQVPDAAPLCRLLREEAGDAGDPTLASLAESIQVAADVGDPVRIAPLWKKSRALPEAADADRWRAFLVSVVVPLQKAADDDIWREVLSAVGRCDGFSLTNPHEIGKRLTMPGGVRRTELLRKMAEDDHAALLPIIESLVLESTPDHAALEEVRPWMDRTALGNYGNAADEKAPFYPFVRRLFEHLTGDPRGVCPQLEVERRSGGTCLVRWNLAGLAAEGNSPIGGGGFPHLEGRFDIDVLAGTHDDRMARVGRVEKAGVRGTLSVLPFPDAVRFRLVVREREGKIIRWSACAGAAEVDGMRLLEIVRADGVPLDVRQSEGDGPFGPARIQEIAWTGPDRADLARWDWSGGEVPALSGWCEVGPGLANLWLEFRNGNGVLLGSRGLVTRPTEPRTGRHWRKVASGGAEKPPAATALIVLVAGSIDRDAGGRMRVADLACRVQSAGVPAGLREVGRIPGGFERISMDAGGSACWGVSSKQGVGVFNPDDGKFSGWMDPPESERAYPVWIGLAGNRVVWIHGENTLRSVRVDSGVAVELGRVEGFRVGFMDSVDYDAKIRVSPDGKLLAHAGGGNGVRLIELGDKSIGESRAIGLGFVHSLGFDRKENLLRAWLGDRVVVLPLEDWRKAEPKPADISGDAPERSWEGARGWDGSITTGAKTKVNLTPIMPGESADHQLWTMGLHRNVNVPFAGRLVMGADRVPYYVGESGLVFRIEVEKLAGYTAPGADGG